MTLAKILGMRAISLILLICTPLSVMAWNPFANEDLVEVALTKVELQKIDIKAGWAKGDDHTLIFELTNSLKGPIQCGSVHAELNNGQTTDKQFVPKFAVSAGATRNASMNVVKGTLKSYALSCSCFKKKGIELCLNPLKSS